MLASSSPLTTILRLMETALLINAKLLQSISHFISPPLHSSMDRSLLWQPPKEELLWQTGVIHPSHVAHLTQFLCRHNILQRIFYSKFPSYLYAGKMHHVLLDPGDSEIASKTFVVEGLSPEFWSGEFWSGAAGPIFSGKMVRLWKIGPNNGPSISALVTSDCCG